MIQNYQFKISNCFFQVLPQKIVTRVEILRIGWPRVIGLTRNEFVHGKLCLRYPSVLFDYLISRTENLNTSGVTSHGTDSFCVKPITPGHPVPKISTRLTISWGFFWKQSTDKRGHQKKRNQMDSTRNAQ